MMSLFSSLALFLAPSIYFAIQNLGLGKDSELFLTTIMSIAFFGIATLILSPLILLKKKKVFLYNYIHKFILVFSVFDIKFSGGQ